jgi:transposase
MSEWNPRARRAYDNYRKALVAGLNVDSEALWLRVLGVGEKRGPRRKVGPAVLRALAAEGLTRQAAAERLGCHYATVVSAAKKAGILFEHGNSKALRSPTHGTVLRAKVTRERIADAVARGLSQAEAAVEWGVSKQAVSAAARAQGISWPRTDTRRHDYDAIKTLHVEGLTDGQIAARLEIVQGVVTDIRRRALNLPPVERDTKAARIARHLRAGKTLTEAARAENARAPYALNVAKMYGITDYAGRRGRKDD